MAKGKHATALFEVICTSKKPPKASSTGGIATPKWWFKGRNKPAAPPKMSVTPVEVVHERIEPSVRPAAAMRIAGETPLALDPTSREIRFKLSYAGVAAAGFVLIIILAIAYMVGTRTTQIGQVENFQRANPLVANDASAPAEPLLAAVTSVPAVAPVEPAPQQELPKPVAEAPAAPSPEKLTRQVGLNYVIFQSYPDPAVAERAQDFLIKAGFPCTIVKLPGSSWSSVLSLKGFDHIQRNPELEDYLQKIGALADAFAGKRQFNRFDPHLFKWRAEQESP